MSISSYVEYETGNIYCVRFPFLISLACCWILRFSSLANLFCSWLWLAVRSTSSRCWTSSGKSQLIRANLEPIKTILARTSFKIDVVTCFENGPVELWFDIIEAGLVWRLFQTKHKLLATFLTARTNPAKPKKHKSGKVGQGMVNKFFFSWNISDYSNLPTIGSGYIPEEKVHIPQNFQHHRNFSVYGKKPLCGYYYCYHRFPVLVDKYETKTEFETGTGTWE